MVLGLQRTSTLNLVDYETGGGLVSILLNLLFPTSDARISDTPSEFEILVDQCPTYIAKCRVTVHCQTHTKLMLLVKSQDLTGFSIVVTS